MRGASRGPGTIKEFFCTECDGFIQTYVYTCSYCHQRFCFVCVSVVPARAVDAHALSEIFRRHICGECKREQADP